MDIAFLGLGAMGARMAARLVAAGHAVAVWNRSLAAAAPLVAAGARLTATPAEAASGATVVFSMVTDDVAARRVWLGGDGAAAALRPGAVAIECSTVTPGWVRELAGGVAARGAHLLDAPVAGSRPQAEAGQLVFMVGGEAAALEAARPAAQAAATLRDRHPFKAEVDDEARRDIFRHLAASRARRRRRATLIAPPSSRAS